MGTDGKGDHLKLLLIGDVGVGKKSIIDRFPSGTYAPDHISSQEIYYKIVTFESNGNKIKIEICYTATQEPLNTISSNYYRCASGIIIAYDVTNKGSFDKLDNCFKDIESRAGTKVIKLLVGNKCDMVDKKIISKGDAKEMAQAHGIDFIEASATANINISTIFNYLVHAIIEKKHHVHKISWIADKTVLEIQQHLNKAEAVLISFSVAEVEYVDEYLSTILSQIQNLHIFSLNLANYENVVKAGTVGLIIRLLSQSNPKIVESTFDLILELIGAESCKNDDVHVHHMVQSLLSGRLIPCLVGALNLIDKEQKMCRKGIKIMQALYEMDPDFQIDWVRHGAMEWLMKRMLLVKDLTTTCSPTAQK